MHDHTLMERESGGLRVEIRWLPADEIVVLQVRAPNGDWAAVEIAPEQAREAFDHPTLFLSAEHVALLFPRGS